MGIHILNTITKIKKSEWERCWGRFPLFEYSLFVHLEKVPGFEDAFWYVLSPFCPSCFIPYYDIRKVLRLNNMLLGYLLKFFPFRFLVFGHPLLGAIDSNWLKWDVQHILQVGLLTPRSAGTALLNVMGNVALDLNAATLRAPDNAIIRIEGYRSFQEYLDSQPIGKRKRLKKRYRNVGKIKIEFLHYIDPSSPALGPLERTERKALVSVFPITFYSVRAFLEALEKSTVAVFSTEERVIGAALLGVSNDICFLKRIGINYETARNINVTVVATKAAILYGIATKCKVVNIGRGDIRAKERLNPETFPTFHVIHFRYKVVYRFLSGVIRAIAEKHQ